MDAWFLGSSWTHHPDVWYFLPQEITSCYKKWFFNGKWNFPKIHIFSNRNLSQEHKNLFDTRNKLLPQELNSCHKKQMLVKRNKCFSAIRTTFFHLIPLNHLATIINAWVITEIDTLQISCQKFCHSGWDYNSVVPSSVR